MSDVNLMADTQSECSHTPGPWWVERRLGDALQVNAKHRGEGSSYCVASLNHWEGDADKANARLIAAAPDMLWKLRELAAECAECAGTGKEVRYMNGIQHEVSCRECDDIRKVIAKAEGRS